MPLDLTLNLPDNPPNSVTLTHESFRKGVITLIDRSRVPRDALVEAKNIILSEDGTPTVRPGVDWFGAASPNGEPIDGGALHEMEDGTPHALMFAGGVIYRSTDDMVTWEACTGATLTAGHKVYTVQDRGWTFITTGEDNIVRYNGTTLLDSYTALTTPTAPTVTPTGHSGTGYNHYYKVAAINDVGFTIASSASTVDATGIPRASWEGTTQYMTATTTVVTGAKRYDWYYSSDNIDFFYVATTYGESSVTYRDTGDDIINTNVVAPSDNTTLGPKVKRLEQIGSRLWGVGDKDNPWRVWFSGSGPYSGYFSSAYDGGYIDLMKGSQFRPVRVVDYRDGKGTPYATVWCESPDGRGCIWQIALEILTVGSVSITVPSAYRLPGSRGTDAPDSVINVLNDYMFYNSQAMYNLGTRKDFQQLLSTDEISANIRPTIRRIRPSDAPKITGIYDSAKVYMSVSPTQTILYDTERKAWIPEAFTIGFEQFFIYVTSTGSRKLLARKAGDKRFTEINETIQGDYGQPFTSVLTTGLYPVDRNRFEFMYVEEAELELSNQQGTLFVELIGVQRSKGFYTIASESITTGTVIENGWDSFGWDTNHWDVLTDIPVVFSESSIKRYFRIQKELNAYQWRLVTTGVRSNYVLRTLQINGTKTTAGKPRQWRI